MDMMGGDLRITLSFRTWSNVTSKAGENLSSEGWTKVARRLSSESGMWPAGTKHPRVRRESRRRVVPSGTARWIGNTQSFGTAGDQVNRASLKYDSNRRAKCVATPRGCEHGYFGTSRCRAAEERTPSGEHSEAETTPKPSSSEDGRSGPSRRKSFFGVASGRKALKGVFGLSRAVTSLRCGAKLSSEGGATSEAAGAALFGEQAEQPKQAALPSGKKAASGVSSS